MVNQLSSDFPLVNPDDDLLGYAGFAHNLASAISEMAPMHGLVMSINGPWGSGKSTVINFVISELRKLDEEKQPIIIEFNPWWFSGHEYLTRLLITFISTSLGDNDFSELKNHFSALAEIVSEIPVPGFAIGKPIAKKLKEKAKIQSLKEKAEKLLLQQNKKILIIIDDLDRLAPEEIRDIFKTIKVVANFPNVIYLVAFDQNVVEKYLENSSIPSGKDFLEKIIQVPFSLPTPSKYHLRKMLLNRIEEIYEETPMYLFNRNYWANVYEVLEHFISTPRNVVRLLNALQPFYPSLIGEVNPIDYIAIETIRVFEPVLYDAIRTNKEFLTSKDHFQTERDKELQLHKYQEIISYASEENRGASEKLLAYLFPKISRQFTPDLFITDVVNEHRKYLRICSKEIFDIYFRFSLPIDGISAHQMKSFIDSTGSEESFRSEMITAISQKREDDSSFLKEKLDRFLDFSEDIPTENIQVIFNVFFRIGDQLIQDEDKDQGMFSIGNDDRIIRILHWQIIRLPQNERFEVLKKAIKQGEAYYLISRQLRRYGAENGKYTDQQAIPEENRTINLDQLVKLEELAVEKIINYSRTEDFSKSPLFLGILHNWRWLCKDQTEVKSWASEFVNTEEGLATFIEKFGRKQPVHTSGERYPKIYYRLNPKQISLFIDLEDNIDRIRRLQIEEWLTDLQKRAINQLLKEYDMMNQGMDLDFYDGEEYEQ